MTREIKFRVWDQKLQCFSYFNLRNCAGHLPKDIPDENVHQYTGLNDLNKIDIYEGDICRFYCPDNHYPIMDEVYFSEGQWEMKNTCDPLWEVLWSSIDEGKSLSVEGNVFQTPDLLCKE